jgi:hypothetical protein
MICKTKTSKNTSGKMGVEGWGEVAGEKFRFHVLMGGSGDIQGQRVVRRRMGEKVKVINPLVLSRGIPAHEDHGSVM